MKTAITINSTNRHPFWFLKDGTRLDIGNQGQCDLYVQQVLSHGRTEDVRRLLQTLPEKVFTDSFRRVERFLPKEVRGFWEKCPGNQ